MKAKFLVFISCLVLSILILPNILRAGTPDQCVDSDAIDANGQPVPLEGQYTIPGSVKDPDGSYSFDFCAGNTLVEFSCGPGGKTSSEFYCKNIQKDCCFNHCCSPADYNVDADGDGVIDKGDNCLGVYNPAVEIEKDGDPGDGIDMVTVKLQPNADGDSMGDACDKCPNVASPDNSDLDGDGIGDVCDKCPCEAGETCSACTDTEGGAYKNGGMDKCDGANKLKEVQCSLIYDKPCKQSFPINCKSGCNNALGICVLKDPDKDGDGHPDTEDNCPNIHNVYQEDMDSDGIGDVCDDSDGDGKFDFEDNCPKIPNPDQLDSDKNGIGDVCDVPPDFDDDKILNVDDNCPATPNSDQADSDKDGIGDACEPPKSGDPEGDYSGGDGDNCKDVENSSQHKNSLSTLDWYAVTGVPNGKIYVAGEGGNIIYKYGDEWKKMASPWDIPSLDQNFVKYLSSEKKAITSLWVSPDKVPYAATASGHIFKYENGKWTDFGPLEPKVYLTPFYAIHGNKDEIWAVGDKGLVWRYTVASATWEKMEPMILKQITTTDKGKGIYSSVTSKIKYQVIKFSNPWRGVHVLVDKIFLVGDGGKALEYKKVGGKLFLYEVNLGTALDLRAVWARDNFVAISGGGKIWQRTGAGNFKLGWSTTEQGKNILGMGGTEANNFYIVGTMGLIHKRTGNTWDAAGELPFSNSLTDVWSDGTKTIIAGINGAIYTLSENTITPTYTMRNLLSHPEWTDTRWTALAVEDYDGDHEDAEYWLGGDDLAIVYKNDYTSTLFYSDDTVIPNPGYSSTKKDIKDLYYDEDNETLHAVGNMSYLLGGDVSSATDSPVTWQQIPLQTTGGLKKVMWFGQASTPDMRSVRKGPDDGILLAGSLGVFTYNDGVLTKLIPDIVSMLPAGAAVADMRGDEIWIAVLDGTYVNVGGTWMFAPWDNPISPIDIKMIHDQVVVIGDKASSQSQPIYTPYPPKNLGTTPAATPQSHYYASEIDWDDEGTKWWKEVPLPKEGVKLVGLHRFDESVDALCINEISLHGMVVTGTDGFLGARYNHLWKEINTDSTETWYDGTYDFSGGVDCWDMESSFTIKVIGVGGHNDIIDGTIKIECSY